MSLWKELENKGSAVVAGDKKTAITWITTNKVRLISYGALYGAGLLTKPILALLWKALF